MSMSVELILNRRQVLTWHFMLNECQTFDWTSVIGQHDIARLAESSQVILGTDWVRVQAKFESFNPLMEGASRLEMKVNSAIRQAIQSVSQHITELATRYQGTADAIIDVAELSYDMKDRIEAQWIIDLLHGVDNGIAGTLQRLFGREDQLVLQKVQQMSDEGEVLEPLEVTPWANDQHWWRSLPTQHLRVPAVTDFSHTAITFSQQYAAHAAIELADFCHKNLSSGEEWLRSYAVEGLVQFMCGFVQARNRLRDSLLFKPIAGGHTIALRFDEDRLQHADLLHNVWHTCREQIAEEGRALSTGN